MNAEREEGMLSVIIPAFNEEHNIPKVREAVAEVLTREGITYEIIFVNDGSSDKTWEAICAVAGEDRGVRGVSFSRNFGKEAAIYAGLAESSGDCVVVMDSDLQHPPNKIAEMYRLWQSGFEVVEGIKSDRGREGVLHKTASKWFYRLISRAAGADLQQASDFKLLDKKAVRALLELPEKDAFFRALSSWIGFKSCKVEYEVQERFSGKTHWSTGALFRYAISNISSFTTVPMQIVTWLGGLMFLLGVGATIEAIYTWAHGRAASGFTTVIILQCFIGSIIMISLGVVGHYIAKVYEEMKGRPRYIISERTAVSERQSPQTM